MSREERTKWNAIHDSRSGERQEPAAFLVSLEHVLPRSGRAIDIAGGTGRHALWLARRGLQVTLVDVSEVAVEMALQSFREEELVLNASVLDLDDDPLPRGPWNVILCYHYLQRDLYRSLSDHLAPGGLLMVVQPTLTNLDRHDQPSERFLLKEGEIANLVLGYDHLGNEDDALEVIHLKEEWTEDGRHEACVIARKNMA